MDATSWKRTDTLEYSSEMHGDFKARREEVADRLREVVALLGVSMNDGTSTFFAIIVWR